jgi:hypothetical protein
MERKVKMAMQSRHTPEHPETGLRREGYAAW